MWKTIHIENPLKINIKHNCGKDVENYVEKSDEKFTSFPQWKTFSTKKLLIE